MLAEVFEFKRQFFHDVIVDAARDADTARIRQPFEACGDVHPVAENISVLQHDVADIDPNAKLHSAIFFEVVVLVSQFILDVDGALDGGERAAERGKDAVAGGPANSSFVPRDETIGDDAESRQSGQRSFLIDFHEPAVTCDISGKDGDELSLEGRRFHLVFLFPSGVARKR